jgi:hypothetical protein
MGDKRGNLYREICNKSYWPEIDSEVVKMKNTAAYQSQSNPCFMLTVNEPGLVLSFLIEKMGFNVSPSDIYQKEQDKTGIKCISLKNSCGNQYMIPISVPNSITSANISSKTVIINTNDCLRDYYNLRKKEEITFYTKPKYLAEGLAFEASDKWGNVYMIIENRNYTDN